MKVGDIVEYFPRFYTKRTGIYIGTIVEVLGGNVYAVKYTTFEDGKAFTWVDLEHADQIIKLTKLELALR